MVSPLDVEGSAVVAFEEDAMAVAEFDETELEAPRE
jgi:hypothetical protein